jgi:ParB family chromosome partitioning protein
MTTQSDTPAVNPAEVPVYEARTLYQIPIDRVREDPDQPRKSFDAIGLEEMVASVTKHGIIQPILFLRGPDHRYVILDGRRPGTTSGFPLPASRRKSTTI